MQWYCSSFVKILWQMFLTRRNTMRKPSNTYFSRTPVEEWTATWTNTSGQSPGHPCHGQLVLVWDTTLLVALNLALCLYGSQVPSLYLHTNKGRGWFCIWDTSSTKGMKPAFTVQLQDRTGSIIWEKEMCPSRVVYTFLAHRVIFCLAHHISSRSILWIEENWCWWHVAPARRGQLAPQSHTHEWMEGFNLTNNDHIRKGLDHSSHWVCNAETGQLAQAAHFVQFL